MKPLRDKQQYRVTDGSVPGQERVWEAYHEADVLSDQGSIDTIGKQKLYPNDCGCFGPLGGRCVDCGAISCRACHGRCAQCAKPICLECTEFMDISEAGARIRLCLQCHGKLARKRMLVKVGRLLLLPFVKIDR